MKTVADVRKAIKPLGFKVKTTAVSWGKAATYTDTNGAKMPDIFFTNEALEHWKPLIAWRKANREALQVVRENEDCTGLL